MVVEDTAPRFDRPTYTDFSASEEEDVRQALDMNVFRVLLTVIGDQQLPKRFMLKEVNASHPLRGWYLLT